VTDISRELFVRNLDMLLLIAKLLIVNVTSGIHGNFLHRIGFPSNRFSIVSSLRATGTMKKYVNYSLVISSCDWLIFAQKEKAGD